MTQVIHLDVLPYEILCHIAAFTAPVTILALSQTCHALRQASYEPWVFKEALAHQQLGWDRDAFVDTQVIDDVRHETAKWARLAVAGQRALELKYGYNGEFRGECFEACLRWAPHLVVLRHPFTSSPWLALKLSEVVHGMPLDLPGVFWYTAAMLSTDEVGHAMVCDNMFGNERGAKTTGYYQLNHLLQVRSKLKAFRAVGVFAVWLRKAIKCSKDWTPGQTPAERGILAHPATYRPGEEIRRFLGAPDPDPFDPDPPFGPLRDTEVLVPSAWDFPTLPIGNEYELPLPFPNRYSGRPSRDYWDAWFQQHIERMSKPAYLEDGPWCGYYMNVKQSYFDKPMTNINFSTNLMDDMSRHYIRGRGEDHIGEFFLGGVLEDCGKMRLRKVYDNGIRYHNECMMTPFGIYGVWGDGEHFAFNQPLQSPLGAFWLWKSDWKSR